MCLSLRPRYAGAAFVLSFPLLIVSCGGKSDNGHAQESTGSTPPVALSEQLNGVSVPITPPEAENQTFNGVDVNGNGVRDDVERLLAAKFGNAGYTSLIDLAKAYQDFINIPLSDSEKLQAQWRLIENKRGCLLTAVNNKPDAPLWVASSVFTTKERLDAFETRLMALREHQVTPAVNVTCGG